MAGLSSVLILSEWLVIGKIVKLRIEAKPSRKKFGCTIDYNQTYFGSTIEQACSKALAALEKKSEAYGEKLLKETGTDQLFAK